MTSGVTQAHQPPPARGRRQNKHVVLRHDLDQEASTKQLLRLNFQIPLGRHWEWSLTHGKSRTGGRGRTGPKAELQGRSSSGTDCGDTLSSSLPWQLEQGLSRECRAGNYRSRDATGLARLSIYSSLPAQLSLCAPAHR